MTARHEPPTDFVMTEPPAKQRFWTFNAGNLIGGICVVISVIYGASAFATKTTVDADSEKIIASKLEARYGLLDTKLAAIDSRVVAVETAMVYIRESLARIERAVTQSK